MVAMWVSFYAYAKRRFGLGVAPTPCRRLMASEGVRQKCGEVAGAARRATPAFLELNELGKQKFPVLEGLWRMALDFPTEQEVIDPRLQIDERNGRGFPRGMVRTMCSFFHFLPFHEGKRGRTKKPKMRRNP